MRIGAWMVLPVRWAKALGRSIAYLWMPLAATIAILAGTIWLWSLITDQEHAHYDRLMRAESGRLASEVARHIESCADEIERIARSWERRPAPSRDEWEAEVARVLATGNEFRVLEWRDRSYAIQNVAPAAAALTAGHPELEEELIRSVLEQHRERGRAWVSRTNMLPDGHRQLFLCAPVIGPRDTAYIVASLRVHDVLGATLAPGLSAGYSVTVYEGPFLIFGPVWVESGPEGEFTGDAVSQIQDLGWLVQVWPSADMLRRLQPLAPITVLTLGILVALLTFALLLPEEAPPVAAEVAPDP